MPIGVAPPSSEPRRLSANARLGSSRCASWRTSASSPTSATSTTASSPSRVAHDAALELRAEADRLAVLELDDVRRARLLVGQRVEGAVVEHRAVLVDLDQRGARMGGRGAQHRRQVVLVGVERARDERRAGAERERDRVERRVGRAERRRLGDLAELAGRRGLALRQPVDAVVEEQDLDRDVAAQRVDQVVAADRERVAVAGDDPHREVGAAPRRGRSRAPARGRGCRASRRCSCSRRSGPAQPIPEMNTVRSGGMPELGQEALHRGEDRVVAAARAPARLDRRLEVGLGQLARAVIRSVVAHSRFSSLALDLGRQQRPALR